MVENWIIVVKDERAARYYGPYPSSHDANDDADNVAEEYATAVNKPEIRIEPLFILS